MYTGQVSPFLMDPLTILELKKSPINALYVAQTCGLPDFEPLMIMKLSVG